MTPRQIITLCIMFAICVISSVLVLDYAKADTTYVRGDCAIVKDGSINRSYIPFVEQIEPKGEPQMSPRERAWKPRRWGV
jgi:hypothetical protein